MVLELRNSELRIVSGGLTERRAFQIWGIAVGAGLAISAPTMGIVRYSKFAVAAFVYSAGKAFLLKGDLNRACLDKALSLFAEILTFVPVAHFYIMLFFVR